MSHIIDSHVYCEYPKMEFDKDNYECPKPAVYFVPSIGTCVCEDHVPAEISVTRYKLEGTMTHA